MSLFRSYFSKSGTLIYNNSLNTSKNPVTELVYGGVSEFYTRFIFKLDLNNLVNKINTFGLTESQLSSHKLNLTNTINYRSDLIGTDFYDSVTKRANSVRLQIFTIDEEWDEGTGFDIVYDTGLTYSSTYIPQAVNWFERKTNTPWTNDGIFVVTGTTSGNTLGVTGTTILNEFTLELGNENINVDITNYVNGILFSGATNNGIGISFTPEFENLRTVKQLGIGFHTNKTNTFFEPYLETSYDSIIFDDRRYFYQDKLNKLYLYTSAGSNSTGFTVNNVKIYDYRNNLTTTITGTSINKSKNGVYYIEHTVNSSQYPDSVNFKDVWNVNINNNIKDIENKFYIIPFDNYYMFNIGNDKFLNKENYHFNFNGIQYNEKIKRGENRKINFVIKELYKNDIRIESFLKYRLFIKHGTYDIDIIPLTDIYYLDNKIFIELDTIWLIENEYHLEVSLEIDSVTYTKRNIKFFIV